MLLQTGSTVLAVIWLVRSVMDKRFIQSSKFFLSSLPFPNISSGLFLRWTYHRPHVKIKNGRHNLYALLIHGHIKKPHNIMIYRLKTHWPFKHTHTRTHRTVTFPLPVTSALIPRLHMSSSAITVFTLPQMNQPPPPDNVFNFPAASPHFYSTCDAPAVTEQRFQAAGTRTREGGRGRGAEGPATVWSTMHLFYLEDSAGYWVDGSLGHEGADLFSSPGQATGFSKPLHCREK